MAARVKMMFAPEESKLRSNQIWSKHFDLHDYLYNCYGMNETHVTDTELVTIALMYQLTVIVYVSEDMFVQKCL